MQEAKGKMIGRMYRPLKILNIPGKRGFSILNKYKSNFGGTFKFDMNIYLNYNAEEQTEVIQVECDNLTIPIYMEEGQVLSEGKVASSTDKRTIESLRKLVRPTKMSSRDTLEFVMMIESSKDESENDILEMSLMPILIDSEEYLKIHVSCPTPVIVHSNTSVKLAE